MKPILAIRKKKDEARWIHTYDGFPRTPAAASGAGFGAYNLDDDGLRIMVLCCLKTLSAVKVAGGVNCRVTFNPVELVRFVGADFPSMNLICERAGLSEMDIYLRSKAVFEYLALHYDAPPP